MKRRLIGLILVVMGLTLAACGSKEKKTEVSAKEPAIIVVEDAPEEEIYEEQGFGVPNPWVDSDEAGVLEATGFDLVAPEGATNIAYSYASSMGMAQLNFNMENAMWIYRMQPTEALEDISGIYCEWDYTGETKVAGMDAMEYSYASEIEGDYIDDMDCTRVVNWYDSKNKVTHSLSVLGKDLNGMDTVVYAENLFASK